jgi:sulfonate transport system permease protein
MATLDATVLRRIGLGRPDAEPVLAKRKPSRPRLGPGRPIPFGIAVGPTLLIAAWVAGSASGALDPETLPAPWTVAQTAGDLLADGRLQSNLLTSVQRAAIGLGIGVAIGVVLALLAGLSRLGEALVDGPIQIKRAIPSCGSASARK